MARVGADAEGGGRGEGRVCAEKACVYRERANAQISLASLALADAHVEGEGDLRFQRSITPIEDRRLQVY
jgi:hypothetical protein